MGNSAFIGLQWGDEAKGKLVDIAMKDHDVVLRFMGGANAGHTVDANGQSVKVNLMPSGFNHSGKLLGIGAFCVLEGPSFVEEIKKVEKATRSELRGRLCISPHVSVVQPAHILNDILSSGVIGATNRGIGPSLTGQKQRADEIGRVDIRTAHIVDNPNESFGIMRRLLEKQIEILMSGKYDLSKEKRRELLERFDPDTCINQQRVAFQALLPFISDDPKVFRKWFDSGKRILAEGAQAAGLDVISGHTPFVTSSHTGIGAAIESLRLPHDSFDRIVGVVKVAPQSRVGNGPFPTEYGGRESEKYCDDDTVTKETEREKFGNDENLVKAMLQSGNGFEVGKAMRWSTGEYGSTTGRPRRTGDFDAMQAKNNADLVTEVSMSRLDCLPLYQHFEGGKIPVATQYELDGQMIDYVPATAERYYRVKPHYEYFPSFEGDISGVRDFDQLPEQTQSFVAEMEARIGKPIRSVGVGPQREQLIFKD